MSYTPLCNGFVFVFVSCFSFLRSGGTLNLTNKTWNISVYCIGIFLETEDCKGIWSWVNTVFDCGIKCQHGITKHKSFNTWHTEINFITFLCDKVIWMTVWNMEMKVLTMVYIGYSFHINVAVLNHLWHAHWCHYYGLSIYLLFSYNFLLLVSCVCGWYLNWNTLYICVNKTVYFYVVYKVYFHSKNTAVQGCCDNIVLS